MINITWIHDNCAIEMVHCMVWLVNQNFMPKKRWPCSKMPDPVGNKYPQGSCSYLIELMQCWWCNGGLSSEMSNHFYMLIWQIKVKIKEMSEQKNWPAIKTNLFLQIDFCEQTIKLFRSIYTFFKNYNDKTNLYVYKTDCETENC